MIFGIGCRKKIFWYLLKLAMLTCMVNWQDEINIKTKTHVPLCFGRWKGALLLPSNNHPNSHCTLERETLQQTKS